MVGLSPRFVGVYGTSGRGVVGAQVFARLLVFQFHKFTVGLLDGVHGPVSCLGAEEIGTPSVHGPQPQIGGRTVHVELYAVRAVAGLYEVERLGTGGVREHGFAVRCVARQECATAVHQVFLHVFCGCRHGEQPQGQEDDVFYLVHMDCFIFGLIDGIV